MFKLKRSLLFFTSFILFSSFVYVYQTARPTLFLIGDSTVKNGSGKGGSNLWGWGDFVAPYFDTNKISIENHALGGTSSRTFQTKGLWQKVLDKMHEGDFLIMQFGHIDGSALDDTARARGTIKGVSEESKEIYNPITKQQEVVHTYGWYLRKFVSDAKAKGATVIICSPIPRNEWKNGVVVRNDDNYGKWAKETAETTGSVFIPLNKIIAEKWEEKGAEAAKAYFPGDHTHTNKEGAELNAAAVTSGLRNTESPLKIFLLQGK